MAVGTLANPDSAIDPTVRERLERFFQAVLANQPFAMNRVTDPAQMDCDVPAVHAREFERLVALAESAGKSQLSVGATVLGQAGTGKSHLLARYCKWASEKERACYVFLHRMRVSPSDMSRYVLKCCISKLAEDRLDRLDDTLLYRIVGSAIRQAATAAGITKLNKENRKQAYQTLAGQFGGESAAFDVIFEFFCAVGVAKQSKNPQSRELAAHQASRAVRWLKGDLIDAEDAKKLGQLVPPGEDTVQLSEEMIENVLRTIALIARAGNRPLVICFDQIDVLNDAQLQELRRFMHSLLDNSTNIAIVIAGNREALLKARDADILTESFLNRVRFEKPIQIQPLSHADARKILEERLHGFLRTYESAPEVAALFKMDRLFPLGEKWFQKVSQECVEFKARDILNQANDRWDCIQQRIRHDGGDAWLKAWDADCGPIIHLSKLTQQELEASIDDKVAVKIEESINGRKLDPGALPADAGNLLGLTKELLEQCRGQSADYSFRDVRELATKYSELGIEETRKNDQARIDNRVLFCVTDSSISTYHQLRSLQRGEFQRRLLVTDGDRSPLKLAAGGTKELDNLKKLGAGVFSEISLSFAEYARLDALMGVLLEAKSGDLQVEPRPGDTRPVSEAEVIASHHRQDRYRKHPLLKHFLIEDPSEPVKIDGPKLNAAEFEKFIFQQLAFQIATGTLELTKQFLAGDYARQTLGTEAAAEPHLPWANDVALALAKAEKIYATPWNNQLFLQYRGPC